MSIQANADAAKLMRIRAEEVLERKGSGASRQAGELAGQFAAMLEQLNGVGDSADSASGIGELAAASPVSGVASVQQRLGIGAVSVFAQSTPDDQPDGSAQTPDLQAPDMGEAMQVVQSALGAKASPDNFRWLTTLLTQTGPDAAAP